MVIDHADKEVSGIERYIPTSFTKILLYGLFPTSFGCSLAFYKVISKLAPNWTIKEQFLTTIIVELIVIFFILVAVLIDQMVLIYQSKHRRIIHYSNEHPMMSLSWLKENATFKHYIVLITFLLFSFLLGYFSNSFDLTLWKNKFISIFTILIFR
jgi:hypothetical protein